MVRTGSASYFLRKATERFYPVVRADADRSPEDRKPVYDYIERCVSDAIVKDREVDSGIEGPITPEAIMDRARKIAEN